MATVARRQATARGGSGREAATHGDGGDRERGKKEELEISMVVPYGVYGYCQERHSAIFDLDGCGFEEEGYPVVDYESALQTAKSTTDFDEMGSRDGFFNKLLNDFVCWEVKPNQSTCPDKIGTIIVIDNLVYRDHPSLKIRGVPKDVRSYDVERVRNKSSYDYYLVLDQRCSDSPTISTLSGRVTTTTWSSTSSVAILPLSLLRVVELRLHLIGRVKATPVVELRLHLVLDQRCSDTPTTFTSSGRLMATPVVELRLHLVLDQRCSDSTTTSTSGGRVKATPGFPPAV
uniref:Ulp1 protease-like n=1 Tax=Oryza sativa subsp. japonica TaxID=39947 RepID=Q6K1N4_ORYSJ|nr:Ulp1 protease-like [Oryza sativa Japonica Group]